VDGCFSCDSISWCLVDGCRGWANMILLPCGWSPGFVPAWSLFCLVDGCHNCTWPNYLRKVKWLEQHDFYIFWTVDIFYHAKTFDLLAGCICRDFLAFLSWGCCHDYICLN
jgi:hypothetical protein